MSDKHSPDHYQSLAERKYAALKQAVEEAGFFVAGVVGKRDDDRITCTSKYEEHEDFGYCCTGRIAFITEVGGRWYLATPHPYHYRVLDSTRVALAVVAFLGGQQEFLQMCIQVGYEEFEHALASKKNSE